MVPEGLRIDARYCSDRCRLREEKRRHRKRRLSQDKGR